ncbi:MAG: cell division protein FtsX [Bacteroidota bacterium]
MAFHPFRNRFRTASATIVISISLALIMLGLLGAMMLKARSVSDYVRENVSVMVLLDRDAREADIIELQKTIDRAPWRKNTLYISRDEAAEIMKKELGEDFIATLGENPLQPTIEINLRAAWANADSLKFIEQELRADSRIKDVIYQKDLVGELNNRMGSLGVVASIVSAALLFIAIVIIFITIRLAIYSQRFLIRTMDLVGATQRFIRRPFVWRGLVNGVAGALLAIAATTGVILALDRNFRDLQLVQLGDVQTLALLALLQLLLGIGITWFSTVMAVRKYLRQSADALYRN